MFEYVFDCKGKVEYMFEYFGVLIELVFGSAKGEWVLFERMFGYAYLRKFVKW